MNLPARGHSLQTTTREHHDAEINPSAAGFLPDRAVPVCLFRLHKLRAESEVYMIAPMTTPTNQEPEEVMEVELTGYALLDNPLLNKSTAFTTTSGRRQRC